MGRHELALCTPATGKLYCHRLGPRPVFELPYRKTVDWGGVRLTTYPAGHCLGSAMLLCEDDGQTLLYSGDFKLDEPLTCEKAELPRADILVIESTYGTPSYRLTPRAEVVEQLIDIVRVTLEREQTPVVQAYALGKAQEVTRILTDAGIPVLQHDSVFEISQIYEACGVPLGTFARYLNRPLAGHAVIMPPNTHNYRRVSGLKNYVSIAVTGWAIDPRTRYRLGVDHAVPLSDHADYDDLFRAVEQVGASRIYCTHGPESFVDRLCEAGYNAMRLGETHQKRLFDIG